MQKITEKDNVHQKWYEEAKEQTLETLPGFLEHLLEDYQHDYGTICHALTAGGIATMWAMDKSDQGGITGFQASCIMWGFIRNWMNYKEPLKLLNYGNMLFPQYEDKFEKTINSNTWQWLQEEAKKKIETKESASPNVIKHWKSIVDGKIPFGYTIED